MLSRQALAGAWMDGVSGDGGRVGVQRDAIGCRAACVFPRWAPHSTPPPCMPLSPHLLECGDSHAQLGSCLLQRHVKVTLQGCGGGMCKRGCGVESRALPPWPVWQRPFLTGSPRTPPAPAWPTHTQALTCSYQSSPAQPCPPPPSTPHPPPTPTTNTHHPTPPPPPAHVILKEGH